MSTDSVGPLWHRVPRGSQGIVVARTADRLIAVRFDTGRVEHLHPTDLQFDKGASG